MQNTMVLGCGGGAEIAAGKKFKKKKKKIKGENEKLYRGNIFNEGAKRSTNYNNTF